MAKKRGDKRITPKQSGSENKSSSGNKSVPKPTNPKS